MELELTKERLQKWRDDPVTVEIFKRIKEAIRAEESCSDYEPGVSASSYGLMCAYSEGVVNGANSLIETYGNLEFEIMEDKGDSNE